MLPKDENSGTVFFPLTKVHPKAVNGAVVKTFFLSTKLEGKPAVWVYEEKPGYFVARTNMSEWVDSPIWRGDGVPLNPDDRSLRAIDLAAGSREACLAAVRLYNM